MAAVTFSRPPALSGSRAGIVYFDNVQKWINRAFDINFPEIALAFLT